MAGRPSHHGQPDSTQRRMEMTAGSAIQTSAMEEAFLLPAFRPDFAHRPIARLPIQHFNGNFEQSIPLHGQHEGSVLIVIGEVSGSDWQTSVAVSKLIHDIRELADDFSGNGRTACRAQQPHQYSQQHSRQHWQRGLFVRWDCDLPCVFPRTRWQLHGRERRPSLADRQRT